MVPVDGALDQSQPSHVAKLATSLNGPMP
jgi:hypothetical protein